jgi:hypothetical protein
MGIVYLENINKTKRRLLFIFFLTNSNYTL